MSTKIFKALIAAALFFAITPVYAQDGNGDPLKDITFNFDNYEIQTYFRYPDYYTINPASIKVTMQEVTEETDLSYLPNLKAVDENPLVIIDQIINIANKIWQIIKLNEPVSTIDVKYASAVPAGITAWNQLSEWKKPKTYVYGFYAENVYGVTMVDVKYKVIYTYGGKYKGKYLGKFGTFGCPFGSFGSLYDFGGTGWPYCHYHHPWRQPIS